MSFFGKRKRTLVGVVVALVGALVWGMVRTIWYLAWHVVRPALRSAVGAPLPSKLSHPRRITKGGTK